MLLGNYVDISQTLEMDIFTIHEKEDRYIYDYLNERTNLMKIRSCESIDKDRKPFIRK